MGVAEAFGIGGHRRVEQAMARLKRNRRNGDSTVDVVGFSRGAAIAISFANDVAEELPDQRIRFIGVFDVVGRRERRRRVTLHSNEAATWAVQSLPVHPWSDDDDCGPACRRAGRSTTRSA